MLKRKCLTLHRVHSISNSKLNSQVYYTCFALISCKKKCQKLYKQKNAIDHNDIL